MGAVDIPQPRAAATVQDVEQQAVIATLRFHRPEQTPIRRKMHTAVDISWRKLQVGDELLAG